MDLCTEERTALLCPPLLICVFLFRLSILVFTSSPTDPVAQQELLSNVSSTLPRGQALECEGSLTLDECHKALIGMAHRKAPGLDGFPMEFYVKFGVFWVLTLWMFLTLAIILVLCLSLSTGVSLL